MSSELAKVSGDQRVESQEPPRPSRQPPVTPDPSLPAVSPDPPFLKLAQLGISFEDIRDGLLLLLCQEAEVQQPLSFRSWPMCHGGGGQDPKPLLRWVVAALASPEMGGGRSGASAGVVPQLGMCSFLRAGPRADHCLFKHTAQPGANCLFSLKYIHNREQQRKARSK